MNPSPMPHPSPGVHCTAAAFAALRVPAAEVPSLRQKPHPTPGYPVSNNLLKHADDQTVVGMAAVLRAVTDFGMDPGGFSDWGVLAAPRFLGRAMMAQAIQKFVQEGAWGISPHLIPHRSLHAISGTVSQALKIHGPNLGVGGGPYAAAEGLLVANAMLARDRLPGVWLVLTGVEREAVFGAATPVFVAVALALVADGDGPLDLEITPELVPAHETDQRSPPLSLEALVDALTAEDPPGAAEWRLACGGRLRLKWNAVCEEKFT